MNISIVIPVWNEEENIRPLCKRIVEVMSKIRKSYEVILVDDGSSDRTLNAIKSVRKKEKRVRFISFRRNFGKSAALLAGFEKAKGKFIITMDGDLQDDPNEILNFIRKINEGYDMVVGWRFKRQDSITKRLASKFFNRMTACITGLNIHDSNCCFKMLTRDAVKEMKMYGELHRYIPALAHWRGFRVTEIKVQHHSRVYGKSKYGVGRLVKGMLDLITIKFLNSYGKRPMHIFGSLGMLFLGIGFLINLYLSYLWIFLHERIGDRPLLMLGILLMVLGVQFISIGLLGEMIASWSEEKGYSTKDRS